MVIIFQPEIRKLLERAASLSGKRFEEDVLTARLVADAVFDLAVRGEGAIIVLPGKEAVRPWVSEGVRMDAAISYPLLMSVFDPHSPGHDGALIIENGKVASFGVRLPLSESGRLSEEFGTRHHAGLGLAEATDALVIVVSEERSEVRVFVHGGAEHVTSKDVLLRSMQAHWQRTASHARLIQPGRKKRTLFVELGVSFILALLFWSSVVLTQTEIREASYDVPVSYLMTSGLRVADGGKVNKVLIHVAGPVSILERLDPSRLDIQVDLRGAAPGEQRVLLTSKDVRLPRGVRFMSAEPERFSVMLVVANSTPE